MERADILNRIAASLEVAGKSQGDLAEALGVHSSAVSLMLRGARGIRDYELIKIAEALNVRACWLLTGEGQPDSAFLDAKEEANELTYVSIEEEEEREQERERRRSRRFGYHPDGYSPSLRGAIPEIDVRVGAGEGRVGDLTAIPVGGDVMSVHAVVAEWLLPETYIRNYLHASPSQSVIFEVVGDSMSPTLQPGDRVIVDRTQTAITDDTVFVISDGHNPPRIKRLQIVMFSNPPLVEVISDNPANSNLTVELSKLNIIGRVVGTVSRR